PPGATVTTLFTPSFSDTVDTQQTGINPTGSLANTLAGVAIVGNTTPPSEGTWRYSTDGGTTWTPIPQTVSDSNAIILSATTRIDFLPAPNFNGAPPPLTARLIDSSTDVPLSGTTTGNSLLSGPQALTGIDVSGTKNGGITAVSLATVPLNTTVPPVNDAPIATGSATLAPVTSGTTNPPGDTITHLFTPSFSDTVDNQKTPINPTGSLANPFTGVVVVGNPTPPADGAWKYSTDGGTTWIPVPLTVSDSNGLVLGGNVKVAFFPDPSFKGTVPPLQVRLIDGSVDVPISGPTRGSDLLNTATVISGVDVSGTNNGGITSVSAALVPLNTAVSPPNRPVSTLVRPPNHAKDATKLEGPGGKPPGYLLGSTVYRSLVTDQVGIINVSADAFYGPGANQPLHYEARSSSGAAIPPWLTFDATTLNFRGTPPESATGTLDLKIIATNDNNQSASAEVHVFIVRQPSDLLSLLRATQSINQPPPRAPQPDGAQPRQPTRAPANRPAAPPAARPPADDQPKPPAPSAEAVPTRTDALGLTAQLREQSMGGTLGRARMLLAALANSANSDAAD
ncbi:MAG: putative Ig domain-containing protein, partial [Alphaproteobacteria bacterium]|nr:putative Ig domain-containing protein [Alphaproteobacteria bacterium]